MANLNTSYLGLELNNPVIVSSSGLTASVDKLKQLEDYGAGAVVLKSLFEEQILYEAGSMSGDTDYPEAEDYLFNYMRSHSVDEYLKLIREAKAKLNIPVIASINCISGSEWLDFTKKIQDAGADALEISVFFLPTDKNKGSEKHEKLYFDLAEKLPKIVSIPLVFKIGKNFTNPVYLVNRLYAYNIPGVVLFNRFYEPDIDIDHMRLSSAQVFSSPSDIRESLRWVGIVSDKVPKIDISASTGNHDGKAVIKQILAGAQTVQVCSTLYRNGLQQLEFILEEIKQWMNKHDIQSLDDIRGKMSYKKIENPQRYERAQFMKYFSNVY